MGPAIADLTTQHAGRSDTAVTQLYFPDPLIEIDPIANAVPMPYRQRMVARFEMATIEPSRALGYLFDIILKGREQTPFEEALGPAGPGRSHTPAARDRHDGGTGAVGRVFAACPRRACAGQLHCRRIEGSADAERIYAGLPAANTGFAEAGKIVAERGFRKESLLF